MSLMLNRVTDAVAPIVGKSHQHTRLVQKLLPGNNVPPRIKDVFTDQAAFSCIISLTLFFSTGILHFLSINGLNKFHFNVQKKKNNKGSIVYAHPSSQFFKPHVYMNTERHFYCFNNSYFSKHAV